MIRHLWLILTMFLASWSTHAHASLYEAPPAQYDRDPSPPALIVQLPFYELQNVCSRGNPPHNYHYDACTIPPVSNKAYVLVYQDEARLLTNPSTRAASLNAINTNRCVIFMADHGWLSTQDQIELYHHERGHCMGWLHAPRSDG